MLSFFFFADYLCLSEMCLTQYKSWQAVHNSLSSPKSTILDRSVLTSEWQVRHSILPFGRMSRWSNVD